MIRAASAASACSASSRTRASSASRACRASASTAARASRAAASSASTAALSARERASASSASRRTRASSDCELLVRLAPDACDFCLERAGGSVLAQAVCFELRLLLRCERLLAFASDALDFGGQPRVGFGTHARDLFFQCPCGGLFRFAPRSGVRVQALELRHSCLVGLTACARQFLFERLHRLSTHAIDLGLDGGLCFGSRGLARLADRCFAERIGLGTNAREFGLALRFCVGLGACDGRLEIGFGPHPEQLDLRLVDSRVHGGVLGTRSFKGERDLDLRTPRPGRR